MKHPLMQADEINVTLTRTRDDKWAVYVDGTRQKGMMTPEVLTWCQELLNEAENLSSIRIATYRPFGT